ncbi:MAG: hypothetical protein AAF637_24580 [Pseudomonadota bacterium]
MARPGSFFTAPQLEWQVDPNTWPIVAEQRDGRPLGFLILGISLVWMALAFLGLPAAGADVAGLGEASGQICLAMALATAIWGGGMLRRRQRISIDANGVHLVRQSLLSTETWQEPLDHYGGVVWRSVPIERRRGRQTLEQIDLWHKDPSRTVTLFTSTSDQHVQEVWTGWAQRLGLTPIRWSPAGATLDSLTSDTEMAPSH